MRGPKPKQSLTRIIPALVHIQAHLDQDLSLDHLADQVGLSKFHFHQLFRTATGETPKSYVERLRLEWAAVQLRIWRVAVLELALECGYRSHETFTRAFRARVLMSPRDYRQKWFRRTSDKRRARFQRASDEAPSPQLSATRVVRLARLLVAFIRHLGSYERVPADHFTRLTAWSLRRGGGSPLLLGISRDAPGITPPARSGSTAVFRFPPPSTPMAISAVSALLAATTPSLNTWARGIWRQPTDQFSSVFATTRRSKSSACPR